MNAVEQEYAIRSNKTIGIRIWEKSGEKIRPRMQLRNTQKKNVRSAFPWPYTIWRKWDRC